MKLLRYFVSPDAPPGRWAVKSILLAEDGTQHVGQYPTYLPTKREAKIEANKRNADIAAQITRDAVRSLGEF